MNQTTRTLTFVGVAALFAVAAFAMHQANTPVSLEEFSDVGTEFYPDFDDPRDATSLRVAAYNKDAARVDVFNVEFKDGLWRIPSHHNYPADGEERLAKTATSIIGLERAALVSTSADDHKRLGVLDPLDESLTGTEGRGDRITLTHNDQTLADYIIGNKIEDGPANTYNVRRADENRTYRVTLDLDLSTKFADWIEPGLLDFSRGNVRKLAIDRYSIDEARGVMVQGETSELSKSSPEADWTLQGIDPATQKVKVATVNQIVNSLEDLKIVGVRPKPAGLSADLKQGSIVAEDGSVSMSALRDLQARGFFLLPDGSLKSNEGEVTLALADGVKYVLGFGEVFTGTDVEIEVGKSASEDSAETVTGEKSTAEAGAEDVGDDASAVDVSDDESADGETASDSAGDGGSKKSRYLFVLTQFDESTIELLPEAPVKPEPPAAPAAEEAAAAEDADAAPESDDTGTDDGAAEETDATGEAADDSTGAEEKNPAEDAAATADEAYKQALADYELQIKNWENRKTEREEKIEAGHKRVQELNDRFADWYYVISAETFDKIRVAPDALVEAVKPEDPPADQADPASPASTSPAENSPETSTDTPEPARTEAPAVDAPPATEPANEEPSADDKPEETSAAGSPGESDAPPEEPPAEPTDADDSSVESNP